MLALEVPGVKLDPNATLSGQQLQLNGYDMRPKLFCNSYFGLF